MSAGISLKALPAPTPPPAGYMRLFVDVADGNFYVQNSAGVVTAIGSVGPAGPAGAAGADGATILSGVVNPTTEGDNGDFYIRTDTSVIFGPKAGGVWPAGVSLIGPTGAAGADGADGNTILYGAVAPTTEGVDGNFYIDTATNMFYGPKAAGVWPAGVSLIGPTGATGPGVPIGGTAGQALTKVDATDYNTTWTTVASAAQGALADTAVQPAAIADFADATGFTSMVALTQAAYDALTPDANTLYFIT